MTSSRIPNLGKLSIALLEHGLAPVLGDKAIGLIRAPREENELRDALMICLKNTETRFVREFQDDEICQVVLNLPMADIPSLNHALRNFYDQPSDSTFAEILGLQLSQVLPSLSKKRIDGAIAAYTRILREELISVSNEIREKLQTHAMLSMAQNTARVADAVESLTAAFYNPQEVRIVKAPTPSRSSPKAVQLKSFYKIDADTDSGTIRSEWTFLSSKNSKETHVNSRKQNHSSPLF